MLDFPLKIKKNKIILHINYISIFYLLFIIFLFFLQNNKNKQTSHSFVTPFRPPALALQTRRVALLSLLSCKASNERESCKERKGRKKRKQQLNCFILKPLVLKLKQRNKENFK